MEIRAPAADSDPLIAAELAAFFLPKDTPLFTFPGTADGPSASVIKSTGNPVWTRDLVILTDSDTTNTAEILATVLHAKKRALVIGHCLAREAGYQGCCHMAGHVFCSGSGCAKGRQRMRRPLSRCLQRLPAINTP